MKATHPVICAIRRAFVVASPLACLISISEASASDAPSMRLRAEINITDDGLLRVDERLEFDLGSTPHDGLERRLRLRGPGQPDYDIEVTDVTDGQGSTLGFDVSRRRGLLIVRIGDGMRFTGEQRRQIAYTVDGAFRSEESHDRLVWALAADEWLLPVVEASVRVELPPGSESAGYLAECRILPTGAVGEGCLIESVGAVVRVRTSRTMERGEALEVGVTLPVGVIHRAGIGLRFIKWFDRYVTGWFIVPLLMGAWMVAIWAGRGRDPRVEALDEKRPEPPEGFAPAEVGTIWDEFADAEDLSATLLDLAVRGYVRFVETEKRPGFLGLDASDYKLEWVGPDRATAELLPYERDLVDAVFGLSKAMLASDLRYTFRERLPRLRASIFEYLDEHAHVFASSPRAIRARYRAFGGLWFIAAAVFGVFFQSIGAGAWLSVAGLILIGMARAMPVRTTRGRALLEETAAFRLYLQSVGDEAAVASPDPVARFERLLPHAYVIGASDDWATAMRDVYDEQPAWLVPRPDGLAFSSRRYISEIGRCLQTLTAALESKPPSALGTGR